MRQLVRHDFALLVHRDPVRDVELLCLGIVQPRDLVGENVEHERIERKVFGDEAEGYERFGVRVALCVVLIFLVRADEVVADFLLRAEALLERLLDRQMENLAHLRKDFVGCLEKFGIRACERLRRRSRRRRRWSCRRRRSRRGGLSVQAAFPCEAESCDEADRENCDQNTNEDEPAFCAVPHRPSDALPVFHTTIIEGRMRESSDLPCGVRAGSP